MLTPDGHCKTLDASADGYTRGEACNALTLLEGAPAAGSAGAAVVGCAVNQDGRSSSLTAPNGPSLPAEGVLGLQMHGTGTAMGDPIEVSALSGVVLAGRGRSSPLALGAVKATSGHAEAAAGTAGVLQAAGCLVQRATALLPHVRELNPLVGNALASAGASLGGRAPAQVPVQEGPQVSTEPAGGACAVGVSSFAYQGSNAHALVAVSVAGSVSRGQSGAWQRRRCWFTAASPNRLVERALQAPRSGVTLLQVQLGGATGAEVHFRSVRGQRAVCESALLEAASAGLRSFGPQAREAALVEVALAPVLGAEAGTLGLRVDLECGAVELGEGELAGRCVACSPVGQCSAGKVSAWGLGAAERSAAVARLEVAQGAAGGYCTHPGLLEWALQLSEGGLPAALEAFVSGARSLWAARAQAGCGQRGAWDVALCGSEGAVCVRGLVHRGVRALGGRRGAWDAAASTHLYEVAWEAARPEGRAEHAPELRMADALAGRMAGAAATLLQVVQVVSTAGSSQAGLVLFAPAPAAGARGAAGHGADGAALCAAGAALGGMLRSVALEIPAMQLACLDPGRGGPVGVGLGPAHAVETDVFGAAADGGARMVPS